MEPADHNVADEAAARAVLLACIILGQLSLGDLISLLYRLAQQARKLGLAAEANAAASATAPRDHAAVAARIITLSAAIAIAQKG